jgi:poly(A) polymerase
MAPTSAVPPDLLRAQENAVVQIVRQDIGPVAEELAARFAAAGHRLYLVGGIVRDAVLGRLPDAYDIDLTTDARPPQIKAIVSDWADAVWTQGRRFGTIAFAKDGRRHEVTTHRAEAYDPDSRKPEVAFADVVEADLSRRDFTVNAMALRLPDPELIDPFDGLADLAAGRLPEAVTRLSDDPDAWITRR